ncbi:hypothetical protein HanXRQr2_Chr04g0168681 [Helianthus annuus]|uniref:Uncharacterized protein n=1 Tax=Helianthus annuus TaxID=4232 RepID=A0A9K3NS01_HELAN|nr:hypothetical protein HanXRQr2_Chr04g0168681 [Helianthus annuus]KAJ0931493.1 hypothetical protein HanPSC8_Chr04g0162271 [Helianthus annuus]
MLQFVCFIIVSGGGKMDVMLNHVTFLLLFFLYEGNGVVEVKKILHFGSLNNVMMSVFGRLNDFGENGGEGCELEELVSEGYELLGIFNWS